MNSNALALRGRVAAIVLAGLFAAGAVVAGDAPVQHLPKLSPSQIKARMAQLLKEMGDLSQYIDNVSDDGKITVKGFSGHAACAPTVPKPTMLSSYVDKERLDRLERALEIMNRDFEHNVDTVLDVSAIVCVDHPKK